jgi:serine/threonine protein kinase
MNAAAPLHFGKYQILETLGSGTMGVVYLAYDPVIDRRVAIKTIRKELLERENSADAAERFRREASAAGRLSHPGIVAVHDYGEDQDVAYIVLEYAPGLELGTYATQNKLSLAQIGGLMGELLDALGFAHAAGVIHRDVKPSNILIADRLKITDFGIARINNSSSTEVGVVVGTPMYMAPEQLMGKGVDQRVDLFAAGVIFYELLTRTRPFDGESLDELCYKICHTDPPAPSSLEPDLPRSLDAVLARALAKSKDARFATAAEFWRAVKDALSGGGVELQSPGLRSSVIAIPENSAWSPDVLGALEGVLAPVLGSVARVAVRRSASRTNSPIELLRVLSDSIAKEPTSAALVEQLSVVLGARITIPPARLSPIPSEPTHIAPEAIARVTLALANYVGPIAKVMTKKAMASSADYLDLCMRLSERLSTKEEKSRFLKEVGIT